MNITLISITRFCVCVALLCIQLVHALDKTNPKDSIKLDSSIIHHQFSNGFTYYLKPTASESDKLTLEFLVKAGFNQEDPDQHTLSHFLEHIVLKAGKHVSVKLLYGSKLAQELNITRSSVLAQTGRDYTAFIIRIPNTPEAKKFAFRLVKDIMNDLEFKNRYIQAEKAPFLDESEVRGGEISLARQGFILDSKILGLKDIFPDDYFEYIQHLPKKRLIRFYEDWYRPDLMGLSITGAIHDTIALQKELKHWFASVPEARQPRPKIEVNQRYLKLPHRFKKQERLALYKDKYTTKIRYRLYFRQPQNTSLTGKARLKNQLIQELLENVLDIRYRQLREMKNWPFRIWVVRSDYPAALRINLNTTDKYEQEALSASLKTLQQLRKYGVSSSIFDNAKTRMMGALKRTPVTSGRYWRLQLRKYFVTGEGLPEQKNQLLIDYLQELRAEDLKEYLNTQVAKLPEDIGLIAPAKHPSLQYAEQRVRTWLQNAVQQPVRQFDEPEVPQQLMDTMSLKALRKTNHKELKTDIPGAKKYMLANGLKLILKSFEPSPDFLMNQNIINFNGVNKNGADCFEESDFHSAINAPQLIKASGAGDLQSWQVKKILKNKGFMGKVRPYITSTTSGIAGRASMDQLETALQLVYMYMAQPRINEAGVNRWKENAPNSFLANVNQDDFTTYIRLYINRPDFFPEGTQLMKGLKQTDMDRAYTIYQSLMGNPEAFTFFFSGDFNEQRVLQLCKKYLGNLPSGPPANCRITQSEETYRKSRGQTKQWIAHEKMTNALVKIIYNNNMNPNESIEEQNAKLMMLARLMEVVLMKELRMNSEKGGPYGIFVYKQEDIAKNYHEINIQFSCPPKDIKRLKKELMQVIERLKTIPVDMNMFQVVCQETMPSDIETNSEMLSKMIAHSFYNVPWYTKKKYKQFMVSLTPEDISEFAENLLQNDPMVFSLMPKKNK